MILSWLVGEAGREGGDVEREKVKAIETFAMIIIFIVAALKT